LYCSVIAEFSDSGFHLAGYEQRSSEGRKLVPWPTTKNESRHGHMTPPRKLYSDVMNWQERTNQDNCLISCAIKHPMSISI